MPVDKAYAKRSLASTIIGRHASRKHSERMNDFRTQCSSPGRLNSAAPTWWTPIAHRAPFSRNHTCPATDVAHPDVRAL